MFGQDVDYFFGDTVRVYGCLVRHLSEDEECFVFVL